MKCVSIGILSILVFNTVFCQSNTTCSNITSICANPGYSYQADINLGDADSIDPGNGYDCLFTTPNPRWFMFKAETSGNLEFSLSASTDVDFIIWGPFMDSAQIVNNCGSFGNGGLSGTVLDCSYSNSNIENPSLSNVTVGQHFVILITNYANINQTINFEQTGGTALASCYTEPCIVDIGSFVYVRNNDTLNSNIIDICENDQISIISQNDYNLPSHIIPQPLGDGYYTAELMYLLYEYYPVSTNPAADPGFLNKIFIGPNFEDGYNASGKIISNYGCGTYYLVPVTGDDGIGGNNNIANGINDNGNIDWDLNNDACYDLGVPIRLNYDCSCLASITKKNLSAYQVSYSYEQVQIDNRSSRSVKVVVYDLRGRTVISREFEPGTSQISHPLMNGIYTYHFYDPQGKSLGRGKFAVVK